MNAIFTAVIIASAIMLLVISPQNFLPALLNGAKNACATALTLFCVYAAWMGLSRLAEKSGLAGIAAKGLAPAAKKIFKTSDKQATQNIAMNLACNLLGLGGAATPYAVKAVRLLEGENNFYAQKLLFIINATSVQIVPSTVIALRAAAGSIAAADIFLPSLICTAFSTLFALLLFALGGKIWRF